MLRAVLDANVYVSAAIRPDGPPGRIIERFLRESAFEIVLSSAIAGEVLRALAHPKVRGAIRAGLEPERWFEDIVVLAGFVAGEHEVSGVSRDPDDDKYLAAAVEGLSAYVVTGDPDLLSVAEYEGIRMVSPRVFLNLLGARPRPAERPPR